MRALPCRLISCADLSVCHISTRSAHKNIGPASSTGRILTQLLQVLCQETPLKSQVSRHIDQDNHTIVRSMVRFRLPRGTWLVRRLRDVRVCSDNSFSATENPLRNRHLKSTPSAWILDTDMIKLAADLDADSPQRIDRTVLCFSVTRVRNPHGKFGIPILMNESRMRIPCQETPSEPGLRSAVNIRLQEDVIPGERGRNIIIEIKCLW